jgi:carboxyl-terminal processing protease
MRRAFSHPRLAKSPNFRHNASALTSVKNKIPMKHLLTALLSLLIITPALPAQESREEVYEKLDVFAQVLERIRVAYVEDVTETEVIENAINGMLTALDPHSAYLNTDDFDDIKEQTSGEFGGLGIEVTMENGVVKVVAPIEDTPAYKAGLKSGDFIIKIDDEDVRGMTLSDAVDRMRGKVNTDITVKVYRESERRTFDVTITRAIIKIKPVKSRLEPEGIGYLRLTTFNEHTADNLREHITRLEKEHGDSLNGIVLDLRNNPGGLLNQAIAVADLFLERGEIVSTRGRLEGQSARYNARPGDVVSNAPMVVLINEGSASASEIVAGALKDHKRAVVLGTKSFGKGSVQTVMPLPGGAGMRLTTALYYTPAGVSIQAKGITPDIEIKRAKIKEENTNNDFGEAALPGHIELDGLKDALADEPDPANETAADRTSEDAVKTDDYQLERALDIVNALALWRK